jgi:hypothetical protein
MGEEEHKIGDQGARERLVARARQKVEELRCLVEMDFFNVGDRYGFEQLEQLSPNPDEWVVLSEAAHLEFIKAVGDCLGVDLLHISEEKVVQRYREEGIAGELSEEGADVCVLKTNIPGLEIHVMNYANSELGTRYDLVRSE